MLKRVEEQNWLITGGCGFIGRALVSYLLEKRIAAGRLRVFDNHSVGRREDLEAVAPVQSGNGCWTENNPGVGLVRGDIRDPEAIAQAANGADVIIHLAACTGVQPSLEDAAFDCETNVTGTLNVLEAARAAGAKRFVFASSGAPLGIVEPPIHENLAAKPISPYGASKLAGEGYCSAYHHSFGLETVVLRFGNAYGPLSSHKSSIVAKFIRRALAGKVLEIYGDGTATRDYIFVSDLIRAIELAATREAIGGQLFQIATSRETSVSEITRALIEILARHGVKNVRTRRLEPRDGDMPRNFSDTTKARELLDWTAETDLEDGLEKTVTWFVAETSKELTRRFGAKEITTIDTDAKISSSIQY